MPWIDYHHIKASVNINIVLARYNIVLRHQGQHHLAGPCPLSGHAGDRSNRNAFHVDTEKNAFNCFSFCGGGNVIDFVAKMEGCEFREAAVKLYEWFLADGSAPEDVQEQGPDVAVSESEELIVNKPLTFELKGLNSNHALLRRVKVLTLETIKHFGLGFCTKGLLAGWVAIPIHNKESQLVAYIGRAVNPTQAEAEGKYKVPPGFRKSLEVFNLHRALQNKETVAKYGLIIVEGFFGVFWLWQCGYKNAVALMGKELSDCQAELLLSVSDRFTIFLDGDEPGRLASQKVSEILGRFAFVRVIEYPPGQKRKPAQFSKEELKGFLTAYKPSP